MKAGFTLIELLAVLAIMSILAVVSLAALASISSAYNLTTAGNNVVAALNLARQEAVTLNATVEFRVYHYFIGGLAGEPAAGNFHAYQLFEEVPQSAGSVDSATATLPTSPLTRVQLLPGRIIFSPNSTLSPALSSGNQMPGSTPPPASLPASYTYEVFHFRPNGSNDFGTGSFLTLVDSSTANSGDHSSGQLSHDRSRLSFKRGHGIEAGRLKFSS